MKTTFIPAIFAAALAAVATSARAADATDAKAAIPAAPTAEQQPADQTAAGTQNAWLGVATKRLPRMVAEHHGLTPGTGLSVEMVVPDSPAAKAGLLKDDVLLRFEDQKLMLPEQLATLVQSSKPGQSVKIEVLRDGQPVTLETGLGARPAEYAKSAPNMESRQPDAGARGGQEPNFDDLDALLGGMLQGGNMADMERHMQRMRQQMERMQQDLQQGQGQAQGGVQMQVFRLDQGRIQINDAQGSITIEKKDGKSTLTAKDKDGKVIFEGPYSTKEEKAIVPENIRKRTERFKIEDGNLAPPVLPGMPQPDEPKMDGHVAPGERVD